MTNSNQIKICIIGLGYVGLPLAIEFGKHFETIGIDLNYKLINNLKKGYDKNNFINLNQFKLSKKISFSNELKNAKSSNIYILTLPTPVNNKNIPDLSIIKNCLKNLSKILKKNDIIIFESTVYPGATEEVFIPIIENKTKFILNKDFHVGYSPERINPGDKKHTLKNIIKIISSSSKMGIQLMKKIYKKIIIPELYIAPSIKVAEAAKVIENTQRDINVAFVNELSIIFDRLNINTYDVLDAAKTKWNFLDFKPGLVGGHCIGVDPYYLSYKSIKTGYRPKMILSGRNINDNYPNYISKKILEIISKKNTTKSKNKILILGYTFKENCNDSRNTQVKKIYHKLIKKNLNVKITDPYLTKNEIDKKIKKDFIEFNEKNFYRFNILVLAVAHKEFKKIDINKVVKNKIEIVDIKNFFKRKKIAYSI